MPKFDKIAKSKEVKERFGINKQIHGLDIALFRDGGTVHALMNRCPHQGAPIHLGFIKEGCVVCPHHGWSFRLDNGAFTHNEKVKIKTYNIMEEDGYIYIETDV